MNENTIKTNETSTNTKEETAMAANSNSTATSTNAKTGSVRYYVTTDTHGYPWGRRGTTTDNHPIDFDLGDNTAGYVNKATGARVLLDPPEEMNAKIATMIHQYWQPEDSLQITPNSNCRFTKTQPTKSQFTAWIPVQTM